MKTNYPHIAFRPFGFSYEDLPAFHAAYFMLIVIFAGLFNLGFFAVLILAHIVLDFVKYHHILRKKRINAAVAVCRESLADLALFFLALSSIIYLNPTLPLIASLTGVRLTHVILMRGLAILLAKLAILHHSMRILFNVQAYVHTPYARLKNALSLAEWIFASTLFLSLCFLAIAPGVLGLNLSDFFSMLWSQLIPWNL